MPSQSRQEALQMEPLTPGTEYFRPIFERADTDGDGKITRQELQRLVSEQDLLEHGVPRDVVARIHEISDTNGDGTLDYPEFVSMIQNPNFKLVFGKFVTRYVRFVVPKRENRNIDERDNVYEDKYSCWPPRIAMILMSLLEMLFFLVDYFLEENSTNTASGPMAKIFIFDPWRREEAWRFLTYMLVHVGHMHLVVNLVVQLFLGIPLELVHGFWRVVTIYVAGVIAGSLGTSLTDPYTRLAGASGGVYSLVTAHIATIIMNWSEMSFPAVHLLIFLLITVFDVGSSIYNRYTDEVDHQIGYAAHLAGAVAGLLVGINVLKNLRQTKKEIYIWWISFILYVLAMAVAILWNIFYTDYYPHN